MGSLVGQQAQTQAGIDHAADRFKTADLDAQLHGALSDHGMLGQQSHHGRATFQRHQFVLQHIGKFDVRHGGQRMIGLHNHGNAIGAVHKSV